MGVQIVISSKEMEHAGWLVTETWEPEVCISCGYYPCDCGEGEYVPARKHLTYTKGNYIFRSYSPDCFCADCKPEGSNYRLFSEAGLLGLKHRFI